MYSLSIDFAARYSAAVLMDEHKTIMDMWVTDFGPAEKPPRVRAHIAPIRSLVSGIDYTLSSLGIKSQTHLVVENVSHFMVNSAPVLRLQGVLEDSLELAGFDEPEWVLSTVWQSHYKFQKNKKGVKAPSTKMQAKALCKEFGYEFEVIGKAKIDLNDAALIARWDIETRETRK